MTTGTVKLHRVLHSTPDRVYRSFLDAAAMSKWLPPNGFTGTVHEMHAEVRGSWRMSFTNFTTGHSHSFGGKYLVLKPNEHISYTSQFDDTNLPGEMTTTITLAKVSAGVDMQVVQEGIPALIPVDQCYAGWQQSLVLLGKLVEAEIRE